MKNFRWLLSRLFLISASLILCFLILEFGIRIWLSYFASETTFQNYASYDDLADRYGQMIWSPHRYLGYYPNPNFENIEKANRHNSLGYRGNEIVLPKPENEHRIVCIGGSTTYTIYTGYRESYPYLLQEQLIELGYKNVTVINAGVPDWTTWESLINMQLRLLDLAPDMIIIYHAVNDVNPRLVWPPEAYRGDNSGYRIPRKHVSDFVKYISLLRIFAVRLDLVRPFMDLSHLDSHSKTYYGDDLHCQIWKGIFPSGLFVKFPPDKILETNSIKYYKRNLENLIAIAQHRGIKVILATFAYTTEFENPVKRILDAVKLGIDESNKELKEIAGEMGVFLFDFANIFPKDKHYFSDSYHVNHKGSALKAKFFADFIHENNLISNPNKTIEMSLSQRSALDNSSKSGF